MGILNPIQGEILTELFQCQSQPKINCLLRKSGPHSSSNQQVIKFLPGLLIGNELMKLDGTMLQCSRINLKQHLKLKWQLFTCFHVQGQVRSLAGLATAPMHHWVFRIFSRWPALTRSGIRRATRSMKQVTQHKHKACIIHIYIFPSYLSFFHI